MTQQGKLEVLDKGYVRLIDVLGSDLTVVNAARCSFDRESKELTGRDIRLIHYLVKNRHTSPLRHAFMQFEIKAPLMVCRQWWKYVVGSSHQGPFVSWNELSRRYVSDSVEYYVPERLRRAPEHKKQGSDGYMSDGHGDYWRAMLLAEQEQSLANYESAIASGMAPEMARGFLLSDFQYTRWRWSASLQGVLHFLAQRLDPHAQYEIREYAKAVEYFTGLHFPYCLGAWMRYRKESE